MAQGRAMATHKKYVLTGGGLQGGNAGTHPYLKGPFFWDGYPPSLTCEAEKGFTPHTWYIVMEEWSNASKRSIRPSAGNLMGRSDTGTKRHGTARGGTVKNGTVRNGATVDGLRRNLASKMRVNVYVDAHLVPIAPKTSHILLPRCASTFLTSSFFQSFVEIAT